MKEALSILSFQHFEVLFQIEIFSYLILLIPYVARPDIIYEKLGIKDAQVGYL